MVRLAALADRVNWRDVPPELAAPDDPLESVDLRFDK